MEYSINNIIISILHFAIVGEDREVMKDLEGIGPISLKKMFFYVFIGKLVKIKKFYIPANICVEAIIKLLEKPTFLDNLVKEKLLQNLSMSGDEMELEKSSFIISILKYCQSQISENQREEICRIAEISPL